MSVETYFLTICNDLEGRILTQKFALFGFLGVEGKKKWSFVNLYSMLREKWSNRQKRIVCLEKN